MFLHCILLIGGNWRTEFEELIVNYSSQPRAQLARIACQYMYTKYPDITWVVIVYEPIAGYEKHTLLGGFSQTHFVYRYHGHNAIISRFAGERIAYDFGLERSLYDSFTPTCYAYCHDPDCLSKYYHVHTETTAFDTFLKLVSNSCSPFFFFTLQYRYSLYNYAGRRDSAGGVNAGRVFGTCSWDSRVVEAQIKTNCDGNYAKMILLGAKY